MMPSQAISIRHSKESGVVFAAAGTKCIAVPAKKILGACFGLEDNNTTPSAAKMAKEIENRALSNLH